MALEAIVYPQKNHSFTTNSNNFKNYFSFNGGDDELWDFISYNDSSPEFVHGIDEQARFEKHVATAVPQETITGCRRKRKRSKSAKKNTEEIENQRMTHISVERNRRKQMNEYLNVLRSLMPSSYVQKLDQASIIGGAINYLKELEKHLHSTEAGTCTTTPFSQFLPYPQFSNRTPTRPPSSAEIEVTVADRHANVKIVVNKKPKQMMNLICGLQNLSFTILHLNVTTTTHQSVLYSLNLKVEENCELNTVEEIAAAINELVGKIQEETT